MLCEKPCHLKVEQTLPLNSTMGSRASEEKIFLQLMDNTRKTRENQNESNNQKQMLSAQKTLAVNPKSINLSGT